MSKPTPLDLAESLAAAAAADQEAADAATDAADDADAEQSSDETPDTPASAATDSTAGDAADGDAHGDDDTSGLVEKNRKANREAAALRRRLKDAEEKAAQWEKHQRGEETDAQRATRELEEARSELAALKREKAVGDLFAEKRFAGIPASLRPRLTALLPEDLDDAREALEELAAEFRVTQRRPDPSQGSGANTPLSSDAADRKVAEALGL